MATSPESVEIYCLKCRAKTGSRDVERVTLKNGRPALRAVCTVCGTGKYPSAPPDEPGRLTGLRLNPSCVARQGSQPLHWEMSRLVSPAQCFQRPCRKPSRWNALAGNASPPYATFPESRTVSIELRSPGRPLRTASDALMHLFYAIGPLGHFRHLVPPNRHFLTSPQNNCPHSTLS